MISILSYGSSYGDNHENITELFPEGSAASFKIHEKTSSNNNRQATITLKGSYGTYPYLAPWDTSSRPDCHTLQHEILEAFDLEEQQVHFQCFQPETAEHSIALRLKEDPQWQLESLVWHNGWVGITAWVVSSVAVDTEKMKELLARQNRLMENSRLMATQWPGLGTREQSLPSAALSFLYGSKAALLNGFVIAWHTKEIVEHGAHIVAAMKSHNLSSFSLNLLALALHTLDGLEHIDSTFVGDYVHLNFRGDIIKASPAPHATNISMSGTSLAFAVHDLFFGHCHDCHTQSKLNKVWKAFGYLHAGFHTYELYEALSRWYYGEPAHEHCHH
ncbi:hypothetical protein [Sansalvadorimonas verongulae]|uniref:hypothetical protein n=1 Tax=Sansalvadorimonas verongulae TaxID=2172824 RepID=UPI001E50CBD7|nr:hypothetical protein [Sansalvadorimonas verongulae]MTI14361.1 hypothetical protein [Sansalvadorimonas verongulae]